MPPVFKRMFLFKNVFRRLEAAWLLGWQGTIVPFFGCYPQLNVPFFGLILLNCAFFRALSTDALPQ
jgi:hypothetical protein